MKAGSAFYLGTEPYDVTDKACNDATLAYARSLTKAPRAKAHRAGYYGFSNSSAKALATATATGTNRNDLPGNLWYALWHEQHTTTADRLWIRSRSPTAVAATGAWRTARKHATGTRSPSTATPAAGP